MQILQAGASLQGGKYVILSILGQGGFGITYLAQQPMLDRKVAIKQFHLNTANSTGADAATLALGQESSAAMALRLKEKFMKEARFIASFDHPNIVHIHDVFEENSTAYYVMDFIEGLTLADVIRQRSIGETEGKRHILQLCNALGYIHGKHILHLDVKPANVILRPDGNVILIDFGISKRYNNASGATSVTLMGQSDGYSPMEQYDQTSQNLTAATDIYSLGATFYTILAGKVPPSAAVVNERGLGERPANISSQTWTAITKAMQPKRQDRPQTIKEFAALLSDKKKGGSAMTIALIAIIACVITIGAYFALASSHGKDVEQTTIVLTSGPENFRNYVYSGPVDSDGKPQGKGEAAYPETKSSSSAVFKGTFANGLPQKGTLTFSSGKKYEGTFTEEGNYAEGIFTDTDGSYFKGTFHDGTPYDGDWYTADGTADGHVTKGEEQ